LIFQFGLHNAVTKKDDLAFWYFKKIVMLKKQFAGDFWHAEFTLI